MLSYQMFVFRHLTDAVNYNKKYMIQSYENIDKSYCNDFESSFKGYCNNWTECLLVYNVMKVKYSVYIIISSWIVLFYKKKSHFKSDILYRCCASKKREFTLSN